MEMEIGDCKNSKGGLRLKTLEYGNRKNSNIEETAKKKSLGEGTAKTISTFNSPGNLSVDVKMLDYLLNYS